MKTKKRYGIRCNTALKKGQDRWYIMDLITDQKVSTHGYYTTRAEAEEYCREMNQSLTGDNK